MPPKYAAASKSSSEHPRLIRHHFAPPSAGFANARPCSLSYGQVLATKQADTGLRQADYPASDPYITSVGGTSDAIGPDGKLKFQTGWGTQRYNVDAAGSGWDFSSFLYGAGGGGSALFNQRLRH